jgi:hypothetical protein
MSAKTVAKVLTKNRSLYKAEKTIKQQLENIFKNNEVNEKKGRVTFCTIDN